MCAVYRQKRISIHIVE